jgi:hypothetical protein
MLTGPAHYPPLTFAIALTPVLATTPASAPTHASLRGTSFCRSHSTNPVASTSFQARRCVWHRCRSAPPLPDLASSWLRGGMRREAPLAAFTRLRLELFKPLPPPSIDRIITPPSPRAGPGQGERIDFHKCPHCSHCTHSFLATSLSHLILRVPCCRFGSHFISFSFSRKRFPPFCIPPLPLFGTGPPGRSLIWVFSSSG